jgi:hypothetical protein
VTDNGPVLNYSFKSKSKLMLSEGAGTSIESGYGGQGTIVINTKIMHDCGFGFSGGKGGVSLSAMGAYARHAG